ncbi:ABC transporter ATP-binding protein [Consotaella aegiceratis]|uniref:ABC transporter ATP-binding protein n=1 Tax=Consotaella aegiceratis TaxID=3097961 RepID=UPI002F40DF55
MNGILVQALDFGVRYRSREGETRALDGLTLDIRRGERLAIIGESGSGKSTFALALAGLLPTTAECTGRIDWPGLTVKSPRPGRDIGFVFQDPGSVLNPVLTIGEQIAEVPRRHLGLSWRDAYARAKELLDRVRLPHPAALLRAHPHQLSGGQRQRVAIATAIAARPTLLIADEATSALDVVVQAEIVTLLDDLVRETGMTLLFVTHDIALASGLADRIAVFRNAALVEVGPAAELVTHPRQAYTAELLASHLTLDSPPLLKAPA